MKVMFMGTPDFAVPSLEALCQRHEVVCVVSQPDKPKGRGHNLVPTQTKAFAQSKNIPVEQPSVLKNEAFLDKLKEYDPDLIVVAAYGKLLPEYILNYPKFGCINVHGSLLPKYRGAAPIQWAVLNGDAESGVTIMHMAKEMDTGDIILRKSTTIGSNETSGELFDRLSILGAETLIEAIDLIVNGAVVRQPQDHTAATYAPMLTKEDALLSFEVDADRFCRFVRGLNPWPIAKINVNNEPVKIFEATLGNAISEAPGTILEISSKGIEVACVGGYSVCLQRLQRPGKKATDGYSFAQGLRLKVNDILK
ncbi:MAG: methionyl-tRNA formyltransferase [Clostridia bacterium]|nr:methionyl-tRNA formyltransferase [Clostridia bacterium]